jgi:hypothetical protein
MSSSLTCRNGHTWQPVPTPAGTEEDRCPRCGVPTRSPDFITRRAWVTLGLVEAALVAALVSCYLFWRPAGPSFPSFPLVALMVLLAVIGVPFQALVFACRQERVRRLEAVCEGLGLAFAGRLSPARLKALGPFRLLRRDRSVTAMHLMEGQWEGWGVALLELRWPGDGESPHVTRTAVIATGPASPDVLPGRDVARHFRARRPAATAVRKVASADLAPAHGAAPGLSVWGLALRLEPLGPGGRLWQWLGWHKAPFPGHPAFAKRYRVEGRCAEAVRRALRPEVLEVFAACPGWSVEVVGGRLLAHREGPCHPDDCPRLLNQAVRMHRALLRAWAAAQKG